MARQDQEAQDVTPRDAHTSFEMHHSTAHEHESDVLIPANRQTKRACPLPRRTILLLIAVALLVGLLTNIDRIIVSISDSLSNSPSPAPLILINDSHLFDYIIVGSGIAGLTQMHIISANDQNSATKTLMLERSNRVGGRAFSLNLEYLDRSITVEYGAAMRFHWNEWMFKVLHSLDLCSHFLPMDGFNAKAARLYRNAHWNTSVHIDVYNLDSYDTAGVPLDIAEVLYEENNNGSAPRTYDEAFACLTNWTFRGTVLRTHNSYSLSKTVWNQSAERIARSVNAQYPSALDAGVIGGYCNMGTFVPFPFPPSNAMPQPANVTVATSQTLKGGYNIITHRLYDRLKLKGNHMSSDPNQFKFDSEVMSVRYNDVVDANDDNGNVKKYIVSVRDTLHHSVISEYYTDNVILSVSAMSVKRLVGQITPFCAVMHGGVCFEVNSKVRELLLDSRTKVEYAYKVNLVYDDFEEWQRKYDIQQMVESITDMDIRSFYVDDAWRNGSLFSILFYSRSYQARQLYLMQKAGHPYVFSDGVRVDWYGKTDVRYTPASNVLVDGVRIQLARLLNTPLEEIPLPIAAFSEPLGLNESGLAGLYWGSSDAPFDLTSAVLQPLATEQIYVVATDYGSPFSSHEGGIYAAIQNSVQNLNMTNPWADTEWCLGVPE